MNLKSASLLGPGLSRGGPSPALGHQRFALIAERHMPGHDDARGNERNRPDNIILDLCRYSGASRMAQVLRDWARGRPGCERRFHIQNQLGVRVVSVRHYHLRCLPWLAHHWLNIPLARFNVFHAASAFRGQNCGLVPSREQIATVLIRYETLSLLAGACKVMERHAGKDCAHAKRPGHRTGQGRLR